MKVSHYVFKSASTLCESVSLRRTAGSAWLIYVNCISTWFFCSVDTAVNTYLLMTYSSRHFIWPAEYWLFNASDFIYHCEALNWSYCGGFLFVILDCCKPMGNWKSLCYFGLSKSVLSSTSHDNDGQMDNKFGTKTLKWYWNISHW